MDTKPGDHINIKKQQRLVHIVQAVLLLGIVFGVFARYWQNNTGASLMTNRSIAISSSKSGANTFHTFTFTLAGGSSVGSIQFEYCSNTPIFELPCNTPVGLNLNGAVLSAQSGETGFSINGAESTATKLVISRPSATLTVAGESSYKFDSIVNPTVAGQSYYVRITAHDTTDASGVPTDKGAVVFVITSADLTIGAYVPPYLAFCIGQVIGSKCTSATGFDLNMGTLSESSTATQTTQLSGATNSLTGYNIYVIGYTLTAGTNVIPAMAAAAASAVGTSQFGLNARANTNPSVGQEPSSGGNLAPVGSYAIPNVFKYASGETIAQSPTSTDFNTITVSYVANTSSSQPAGVYTTTLTYVATSTF